MLEKLLEDAKAGRLVGIAYAAFYAGREYTADVAGEARRNPVTSRGVLKVLDDQLAKL